MLEAQTAAGAGPLDRGAEHAGGTRVERWLLVAIVLAMVLLPTLEAVLRRVGGGIPDAIPYTTHLTLWIGFVGAMLATATERHLSLSSMDLLPQRWRTLARSYGHLVGALVMAVLAYASIKLILADRGRADTLAGNVPEWWFEIIMPVGFAVMAVRSAAKSPTRRARIVGYLFCLAVVPFVVSAVLAQRGHGFLPGPDGPALLRGHTAVLG